MDLRVRSGAIKGVRKESLHGLMRRRDVAPDGVMVGVFDAAVHRAAVGFQVGAGEDVVNAEVEAVSVIGNARAEAGCDEGVVQSAPDDAVGV